MKVNSVSQYVKQYDVLGSRGGITNYHRGNRTYRSLSRKLLRLFNLKNSDANDKRRLAVAIIDALSDLFGTRFINLVKKEKNGPTATCIMTRKKAIAKVMQCFREEKSWKQKHQDDDNVEMANDVDRLYTKIFTESFPEVQKQLNARRGNERIPFSPYAESKNSAFRPCVFTESPIRPTLTPRRPKPTVIPPSPPSCPRSVPDSTDRVGEIPNLQFPSLSVDNDHPLPLVISYGNSSDESDESFPDSIHAIELTDFDLGLEVDSNDPIFQNLPPIADQIYSGAFRLPDTLPDHSALI